MLMRSNFLKLIAPVLLLLQTSLLKAQTDEDAIMMVMIGSPKPITPTYPPEHPLSKVKRG